MAFDWGSGGLQFNAKWIVHNQDNEFEPEYKRGIGKDEKAQLCWDQLVVRLERHNCGPDTKVNENDINSGMENWKSLKRKIRRPGNEEEVEVEGLKLDTSKEVLPGGKMNCGKINNCKWTIKQTTNKNTQTDVKKLTTKVKAAMSLFLIHSISDPLLSDNLWSSRRSPFSLRHFSVFRAAFIRRATRMLCFSNWSSNSCTFLLSCLLRRNVFSMLMHEDSTDCSLLSCVRTFFRKDFWTLRLNVLRFWGKTLEGLGLWALVFGRLFGNTPFCGIQRICSWMASRRASKLKTRISTCVSRCVTS